MSKADNLRNALIANFLWLNRLAASASLLFFAVAVAKMTGIEEFRFFGVSLPLSTSVFALICFTVSHFYIARLIMKSLERGWRLLSEEERRQLYDDLVGSGGVLIRGLFSYQDAIFKETSQGVVYVYVETRIDDPPIALHLCIALLAIVASVPYSISWISLGIFFVSTGLVSVNWQIGSNWAVGLVDFSRPKDEDFLFSDGYGPRYVSTISGFWLSEKSSWNRLISQALVGNVYFGLVLILVCLPFLLLSWWLF